MPNTSAVVGVDGKRPYYDDSPEAVWKMHSIEDVWLGQEGLNKIIPRINDYVINPLVGLGSLRRVASLDPINYVPELVPVGDGAGVGSDLTATLDNSYRVYYDTTTKPYSLTPDAFIRIYIPTASFARIYRGVDLNPNDIISRMYDNSGNYLGHDIPLATVAFNSHDNYAIKSIPSCNTDADLQPGEIVSIVVFNSSNSVAKLIHAKVEDTSYVTQAYAEQKYVTELFLKSPFQETTNPNELNYPINLPVDSFHPIGVVQYNDGSQVEYPIDGDRFSLYGLDGFVSSVLGHRVPLVLVYHPQAGESILGDTTRQYNLVVSEANRSLSVKMMVYPVWVDEVTGYRLKFYMTGLDRDMVYDITSVVGLANGSASFMPDAYGVNQRLTYTVNLRDVSNTFRSFNHVQTVDVLLRSRANNDHASTLWEVNHEAPSAVPNYGVELRASLNNSTAKSLKVDNGATTVDEFLDKVYWSTNPIYDKEMETKAPRPTHMEVRWGNEILLVEVEDYGKTFTFNTNVTRYSNVEIIFYREVPNQWLKLSVAALTVR